LFISTGFDKILKLSDVVWWNLRYLSRSLFVWTWKLFAWDQLEWNLPFKVYQLKLFARVHECLATF
jgi:hypothetical protein